VRVGPTLGNEVPVPAQKGSRLDEEASEASTGEKSCESCDHGSIRLFQHWSVNLASEDCHLMAQHDDLDGEVRIVAKGETDQLKDAKEGP